MREIHLRAWDKRAKTIVQVHYLGRWQLLASGYHDFRPRQDFVLMEYVGQKDIYGVETCEGDIVKDADGNLQLVTIRTLIKEPFQIVGDQFRNPILKSRLGQPIRTPSQE